MSFKNELVGVPKPIGRFSTPTNSFILPGLGEKKSLSKKMDRLSN